MQPRSARPNQSSIVKLLVAVLFFGVAAWVALNRQYIIDQTIVWNYKPSPDIAALATRSSMSERGKFLFYASRPTLDDRATFNTRCRELMEKTAILGCYSGRQIYVFNVTDERLDGIREVTAAHEMLHAVYERLGKSERQRIDHLIEQQATRIDDPKLKARLALYDQTEPGERLNELHSILGSEIGSLDAELERHFAQYFTDRSAVVALSNKYESVFDELERQQKALVDELNALAARIDAASATYTSALASLETDVNSFNARAHAGQFASEKVFLAERSQLLSRQTTLQSQRTSINSDIATYDLKKRELDALSTQAEGLQKSINSQALPEIKAL